MRVTTCVASFDASSASAAGAAGDRSEQPGGRLRDAAGSTAARVGEASSSRMPTSAAWLVHRTVFRRAAQAGASDPISACRRPRDCDRTGNRAPGEDPLALRWKTGCSPAAFAADRALSQVGAHFGEDLFRGDSSVAPERSERGLEPCLFLFGERRNLIEASHGVLAGRQLSQLGRKSSAIPGEHPHAAMILLQDS